MPCFTIRTFGQTFTFDATDVRQLSSRLYRRSGWAVEECDRLAAQLMRGHVVMAPDFETVILPGLFHVVEDRPIERDTWDAEPPLLTGGFK